MAPGGFRVGAGAKPKSAKTSFVHGKRSSKRIRPSTNDGNGSPSAASRPVVPLAPAPDMRVEEQHVWRELAPHAQRAGTLTEQTAASFRRLCVAVVRLSRWQAQVDHDGDTYLKITIDGAGSEHREVKAHPLIARAQALERDVRAMSKDFLICPFGKPLAPDVEPPRDPFDEFDEPVVDVTYLKSVQ